MILYYNPSHEEQGSSKLQGKTVYNTDSFQLLLCPMKPDQVTVELFRALGHQLQQKVGCCYRSSAALLHVVSTSCS